MQTRSRKGSGGTCPRALDAEKVSPLDLLRSTASLLTLHLSCCGVDMPHTILATIVRVIVLDAVADNSAIAMGAFRRKQMDCTLK
jgi:hypothetical protein